MHLTHSTRCSILAVLTASVIVLAAGTSPAGESEIPSDRTSSLIGQCMSDDALVRSAAIAELRTIGQPAVDSLCERHAQLVPPPEQQAAVDEQHHITLLRAAIDAVARQRDAYVSGLVWHTDLDAAESEAARTGRPILSLRLLGNLDEDRSCANSRFFRSVLYANAEVSDYLRNHFVLHWQSLRPVPQLTVDFGDGRRIERTITGNSIHYVLSADGELIDGLPGLYGPRAFLRVLQSAENAALQCASLDSGERAGFLRRHHATAITGIDQAFSADLLRVQTSRTLVPGAVMAAAQPNAAPAAARAIAKMQAEAPAVDMALGKAGAVDAATIDENLWNRIAALHRADAMLDQSTVALMRTKVPADIAQAAQKQAESKRVVETPFIRMMRTFQNSLAVDSVRNEYLLHRSIHHWLSELEHPATSTHVSAFNERVYAELFLTPLNDPWMGLAPANAYAALDAGGLVLNCN